MFVELYYFNAECRVLKGFVAMIMFLAHYNKSRSAKESIVLPIYSEEEKIEPANMSWTRKDFIHSFISISYKLF